MAQQPNILFYLSECKTCNVFITTAQKGGILKYFNLICIDGKKDQYKKQGLKTVPTIIVPSQSKTYVGAECLEWLKNTLRTINNTNGYSQTDNMQEIYVPSRGYVAVPVPTSVPVARPVTNGPIAKTQPSINQLSQQLDDLSTKLSTVQPTVQPPSKLVVPNTNLIKRNNIGASTVPQGTTPTQTSTHGRIGTSTSTSQGPPSVKPINQLIGFTQNEMMGFSDTYAYTTRDDALPKSFLPPDHDNIIFTAPEGEKIGKQKQDELMKCAETQRNFDKEKFSKTMSELNEQIKMGNKNLIPKWHDSV